MASERRRLPNDRKSVTRRIEIGGVKVYVTVGHYEDGTPGELFLKVDKEGDALRAYDVLAIAISIGLQYGVPLEVFVDKLKGQKMEPSGLTGDHEFPIAGSISDYLGRWLEARYLPSVDSSAPDVGS